MTPAATPRPRPCASCPYRTNVPSGVWDPEEYSKLPAYDADTALQPPAVFMCHDADGHVCSGWLGHTDPADLLAVRIGISTGTLDLACLDYTTTVPLHPTGAAAAAHGIRDVEQPGAAAIATIRKLTRTKETP